MLLPTVGIGNETPENPELLVLIALSVLVGANGSKIFDQIQKLMMLYQGVSYSFLPLYTNLMSHATYNIPFDGAGSAYDERDC